MRMNSVKVKIISPFDYQGRILKRGEILTVDAEVARRWKASGIAKGYSAGRK